MKYYLDTEFHEYARTFTEKEIHYGMEINHEKKVNTIELISIGIVSEDDREYYAICNEFDKQIAWENEWLRENVLKSIWEELAPVYNPKLYAEGKLNFDLISFTILIMKYGKTREQITEEIKAFTINYSESEEEIWDKPKFYGYYADYDWVVFCWLFGRMIDLPENFPMYCIDLKQISDEKYEAKKASYYGHKKKEAIANGANFIEKLSNHPDYPRQVNEHNALADARWNMRLHKFLNKM